jgi:two-component system sensor histidine kinase RpfC
MGANMSRHDRRVHRILVAEDNATSSLLIRAILERAGHTCTMVGNGRLALECLEKEFFDLVALDMNMPVLGGLEAARLWRAIEASQPVSPRPRLPLVLFSADTGEQVRLQCRQAGIDDFLDKPIRGENLLATIGRLLASQAGDADAVLRRSGPLAASPGAGPTQSSRPAAPPCASLPAGDPRRRPCPPQSSHPVSAPPDESPVLDMTTLAELEKISADPAFLDGLLAGFMNDNRALVQRLHALLDRGGHDEAQEVVHALKGAAQSVGAIALKVACRALERRLGAAGPAWQPARPFAAGAARQRETGHEDTRRRTAVPPAARLACLAPGATEKTFANFLQQDSDGDAAVTAAEIERQLQRLFQSIDAYRARRRAGRSRSV